MKDVEDDEGEDCESTPNHDLRRPGGLDCRLVGVFGTGRFIFLCEEDGEPDVDYKAGKQADPGDPNPHAMQEGVEEMGVFIERFLTGKDEEIAREVAGEKEDEGQAREGDDNFTSDGRFYEGARGAGRSTHGSLGHPTGA